MLSLQRCIVAPDMEMGSRGEHPPGMPSSRSAQYKTHRHQSRHASMSAENARKRRECGTTGDNIPYTGCFPRDHPAYHQAEGTEGPIDYRKPQEPLGFKQFGSRRHWTINQSSPPLGGCGAGHGARKPYKAVHKQTINLPSPDPAGAGLIFATPIYLLSR